MPEETTENFLKDRELIGKAAAVSEEGRIKEMVQKYLEDERLEADKRRENVLSQLVTREEVEKVVGDLRKENDVLKKLLLRAKAQGKATFPEETDQREADLKRLYPELYEMYFKRQK